MQINSLFPLSLFSWPAAASPLHGGIINSDRVIPMLMAVNEIEGWHAFPFNILGAATALRAHGKSPGTQHILPTAHPCAALDRNTEREIILLSPCCRKPTHPLQTGTAPQGQLVTQGKLRKK